MDNPWLASKQSHRSFLSNAVPVGGALVLSGIRESGAEE